MTSTQTSEQPNTPIDREQILSILGNRIIMIDDRLNTTTTSGTLTAKEEIRWTRTLGYLADQYRKLKNDTDLDEMEAEIESLNDIINNNDETKN